jgi:hypothetical protein
MAENRPQSSSETVSTMPAVTNQGQLDINLSWGVDFMSNDVAEVVE